VPSSRPDLTTDSDRADSYLVEAQCGCKGFEINQWCQHLDRLGEWKRARIEMERAVKHPFKVLAIRQPWAWLVVNGPKDVENRSRKIKFKGLCLIHASLKPDDDCNTIMHELEERHGITIPPDELKFGGIVGAVEFGRPVEKFPSMWFQGPFGYPVLQRTALDFEPMTGQLGFFNAPAHVCRKFAHLRYEPIET
jgi:hypothetical protein